MWKTKAKEQKMLTELTALTGERRTAEKVLNYLMQIEKEEAQKRRKIQKEGIERARKQGVPFGRPRKELPEEFGYISRDYADGTLTAQQAAAYCGIGVSTFYRKIREWGEESNKSSIEEGFEEMRGEDKGESNGEIN